MQRVGRCLMLVISFALAQGVNAKERNLWQVPKGSICEDAIQEHFERVRMVDSAVIQVRAEKEGNALKFSPVEGTPFFFDMQKGLRWWPVFKGSAAAKDAVLKASTAGRLWMEITAYDGEAGSLSSNTFSWYVQAFAESRGRCSPLFEDDRDMVLPHEAFPPSVIGW